MFIFIFGLFTVLPESFNNVVEPILAVTKPADLKYDDIRACLLDESSRRDSGANVSALRFNKNARSAPGSAPRNPNVECFFCKRRGHVEAVCRTKEAAAKKAQEEAAKPKKKGGN